MPDATPLSQSDLSLAEEELQNELRGMFELDTQTYLQTYEQVTQQISAETWTADIQELYRSIHTIKGGAVTVGADAVLATTTALEEMLSDLRYLQTAPKLTDGVLSAVLVEAGDVVSGSLLIMQDDDAGTKALASALGRLSALHEQVKSGFLAEIDEHQQICQDFANQGFDLMVLDLEMALEQILDGESVPPSLVNTAAQIFTDLEAVGKDLEMDGGWSLLIQPLFELLIESDRDIWQLRSQTYLALLKNCALEGGDLTEAAKVQLQTDGFTFEVATDVQAEPSLLESTELESTELEYALNEDELFDFSAFSDIQDRPNLDLNEASDGISFMSSSLEEESAESLLDDAEFGDLEWITETEPANSEESNALDREETLDAENFEAIELTLDIIDAPESAPDISFDTFLNDITQPILENESTNPHIASVNGANLAKEGQLLNDALKQMETTLGGSPNDEVSMFDEDLAIPDNFLDSLATTTQASSAPEIAAPEWVIDVPEPTPAQPSKAIAKESSTPTKIPKIPVPLDRLDRSAHALIEILLSARSTQGRYQSLQTQVTKMVTLSQESSAYITQLRQMQDDYALLQNLSHQSSSDNGVKLEGYRSGYMAINRLLENNLRLSELGAEMAVNAQVTKQEFSKLNHHIKALQSSVEESRLISFKSVAFRLRAVIQDLINRIGKPVNFVIEGEAQTLDAGTIQALEPALLHLLRNAYDHGLESVEARSQTHKPSEATITLSLTQQGSIYHLSLVDDGQGIDRQKIASIAQSKGLPFSQTDTNDALLQVICQPGFSSQTEVSAFSGRGVGMDVVQHQIQQLGGSFQLETTLGEGTRFEVKVPVPHLLVPCIVVKAGPQLFAIPTNAIQTMRLWDSSCHRRETGDSEAIALPWEREFDGTIEPMMPIMQYWQEKGTVPDLNESYMETAICLRIPSQESGTEAIWLVIDELVEELDLLINKLPSPLRTPAGMMGMSALPTGDMIPVLEATTIAQILMKPEAQEMLEAHLDLNPELDQNETAQANSNLILVVDDAALLRRRLEISLLNYGYEVHCCRDGLEAWNWLQDHPTPGLMITDIEMPQMDGLTLVDRCRQAGLTLPILVSSSRLSEEWSKEAKRVGANDYLTKGFSTNELIDRVSSLMTVPAL